MPGTNPVGTWNLPDFTVDDPTTYKGKIDGNFAVLQRPSAAFSVHEQATPNMTVHVEAGAIWVPSGPTLSEVAAQDTATITAPVGNPRIDRVVIDASTGAVSVVSGTEAASPSAPAIPAGQVPVARLTLSVGQVAIANADITDERAPGLGYQSPSPIPSGTKMLFNQSAAPTGWTQDTSINDRVLRMVSGVGGGVGGSWTISGITVGGHALTLAEMAAHSHGAGTLTAAGVGDHSHSTQGVGGGAGENTGQLVNSNPSGGGGTNAAGGHSHTLSGSTDSQGSGTAHSHGLTADGVWRPEYVNIICASKD